MAFDSSKIDIVPGVSDTISVSAAGSGIERGHIVYMATGGATLADADAAASSQILGVVVSIAGRSGMQLDETAGAGDTCEVCFSGPVEGFTGMTVGARQYLATTSGAITETAPSGSGDQLVIIGTALSATRMLVNITIDPIAV